MKMKKTINPFKMVGSYIGLGVFLFSIIMFLLSAVFSPSPNCDSLSSVYGQTFNPGGSNCHGIFYTIGAIPLIAAIPVIYGMFAIGGSLFKNNIFTFITIVQVIIIPLLYMALGWSIHLLIKQFKKRK